MPARTTAPSRHGRPSPRFPSRLRSCCRSSAASTSWTCTRRPPYGFTASFNPTPGRARRQLAGCLAGPSRHQPGRLCWMLENHRPAPYRPDAPSFCRSGPAAPVSVGGWLKMPADRGPQVMKASCRSRFPAGMKCARFRFRRGLRLLLPWEAHHGRAIRRLTDLFERHAYEGLRKRLATGGSMTSVQIRSTPEGRSQAAVAQRNIPHHEALRTASPGAKASAPGARLQRQGWPEISVASRSPPARTGEIC